MGGVVQNRPEQAEAESELERERNEDCKSEVKKKSCENPKAKNTD